jgi:hypothetical protein
MCEEDGGGVVVGIVGRRRKNGARLGVVTQGCNQEMKRLDEIKGGGEGKENEGKIDDMHKGNTTRNRANGVNTTCM